MGASIVIVMTAFGIEEYEPGLAVAHGKIELCVRRQFFDHELLNGSA